MMDSSAQRPTALTASLPRVRSESHIERHYDPAEIAEAWGVNAETVRRIFRNEPGVLVISSDRKKYRKSYATLRIPESVLDRVHRRMRNA